jgi:putative effector of murein hydrolase
MSDRTLISIGAILAAMLVAMFGVWEAWQFVRSHWNDIFTLLVLGIVVGVPVTIAIGKTLFRVGR